VYVVPTVPLDSQTVEDVLSLVVASTVKPSTD